VRAALGHEEKRRRTGRGAVEDDEAGVALTWAREVVRRRQRSSVEVALELREERRRAGMGAAKIG
jgi:hypothetical protein